MKKRTIIAVLTAAVSLWAGDIQLGKLFKEHDVEGGLIISSLDGSREYIWNEKRCETAWIPASTFKIPNTLIALETGVADTSTRFHWDGSKRGLPAWNRDQTLKTALSVSCVWVYQDIAKRVGRERYRKMLTAMNYGNGRPTPEITTFWLTGDLKITLHEQIDFLRKLATNRVPGISRENQEITKDLLIVQQGEEYSIRAKTGLYMDPPAPQHGWYVGIYDEPNNTWLFAINLRIEDKSHWALRKEIIMEALEQKGILSK